MIKITCKNGMNPLITDAKTGAMINGVTHIEIHPLKFGAPVTATLTFVLVELDLEIENQNEYRILGETPDGGPFVKDGDILRRTAIRNQG